MSVLIFANGDIEAVAWLRPYLTNASVIIAANGGTRHLYRLAHAPDILIGDLDSLPTEIANWVAEAGTQIVKHPAAKDETDLELALIYAAENFLAEIKIVGAFGGRLDQTLANMFLLAHPALRECAVQMLTEYQRVWLVTAVTHIHGQIGDTVSLIPLGGDALISETSGLKWALQDETLTFGPARGVSNIMTADIARVIVRSGYLLCIHTQQTWYR